MNKQEVLHAIHELRERGELSKDEVLSAFAGHNATKKRHGFRINDVLYFIGGVIVLAGITVFIGQHWEELNSVTRVLVTFGSGVAAYSIGLTFIERRDDSVLSGTFFFLSAILLPGGIAVALHEWGNSQNVTLAEVIISGLSLVTYLVSFFVFKKKYFLFFSFVFGTWLFFAFTNWMTGDTPVFDTEKFYEYRVLLAGLSYISLGYGFQKGSLHTFTEPLYTLGALAFLLAAFLLGGFDQYVFTMWELVFPALCFAFIFASTVARSNGFLFSGALFLMVDIFKLTSDYFTDSFGWPLSLILCGIALIGIGYGTFRLQKKYIRG